LEVFTDMGNNFEAMMQGGKPAIKYYSGAWGWSWISIPLTDYANTYAGGQTLVADVAMPFVPTAFGGGVVPLVGKGDNRADALVVAPAAEATLYQFDLEKSAFVVTRRAKKSAIELEIEKDSGAAWAWRERVTEGLTEMVRASLERSVFDAVGSSTNVASQWTVKSAFTGGGLPVTAVLGLLDGVQAIGGFRPDFVSFGKDAWTSFAANSSAIARLGGWVTPARAAEVFRVSTVAVHDGQYNAAAPGLTPSFTTFQTPDSISAFCTKGPRWGVRPYWLPPGISKGPLITEQYEVKKVRSTFIEVGCWTKEVVVDNDLAGTLSGVNSSQSGGI
jgi:hypothetical protein